MMPFMSMKNIKNKMVKRGRAALLLLFTCFAINLTAKQIPTISGIMQTTSYSLSPVYVGSVTATNTVFATAVANTTDYNIQNSVSLKYDLTTDTFFLNKTTLKIEVLVDIYNAAGIQIGSTTTKSLTIIINNKLNQPTLEQATLKLKNGYKVVTKINKIWLNGSSVNTLPRWAYVETEINMDRYYDFSSSSNTSLTMNSYNLLDSDVDGINDEIQLNWTIPSMVPEEYQLEWVFVNNYAANAGTVVSTSTYVASSYTLNFKDNSTRISTYNNSYKISLLFEKGFIAFRARGVGRDKSDPTKIIYGPWTTSDLTPLSTLSLGSELYNVATEHEKLKNWQYSTTYAEEGKKKEVINYFDGSLHNRQTVTKINSDNNVIVGETMYDYQGRPAVNVLPVPVVVNTTVTAAVPSIKYYPKFNVKAGGVPYSKEDFDKDGPPCTSSVSSMDIASGASRYYSDNNPDKSKQQAFLPNAKEYPFTQTEYTPDNTGRIRNQSGVGPDYKLGSGKETKYLYGQPNQIQVDRFFASEAGDASHYKKNVVIDANGQTSVTYLNQEGKTIATALAGIPPTVGTTTLTRLDSLSYANKGQAKFTIDLFNKNANGKSLLNVVPPSKDQVIFSTQLLVPFRSLYEYQYSMSVDTVHDACLANGICFNCVYDLEIQVKDECDNNLIATPIKKNIGKFTGSAGNFTFSTVCTGTNSVYSTSETFSIVLQPGVYTVNKILKVNKEAKDFYVKAYLDSINTIAPTFTNSCYKTLSQFQAAELAKLDTSDCNTTCASCAADLGKRDDFVSAGRGTAEQWLFLMERCNEPCKRKTLCDLTYEMMLSDVSPGGQYGKFNAITFDASTQPLSVYNLSNGLRPNVVGGGANWRKPRIRLGGVLYPYYLDEDGVRKKITLTEISTGVYSPSVFTTTAVYVDPATNLFYTYPENLGKLEDFVQYWDPNFARSLVTYHPEFAYYLSCSDHAYTFPTSKFSSDSLDYKMELCTSFSQAIGDFISSTNYSLTTVSAQNKLRDIWLPGAGVRDPFFADASYQYSVTSNLYTGAATSLNMTVTPFGVNLQNEMNYIINNYKFIGTTPYTMADVAAMITRCGNNFSTTPTASCIAFGTDAYGPGDPNNDSIRNREWRLYRQFYLVEKQKLQFKRMNFYAKYLNDPNSNLYGGCNACIDNPSYNPFSENMLYAFTPTVTALPYSPFLDGSQPCGYASMNNYGGVQKRFYDPANTGLNTTIASQQLYQSTGQCPLAFHLQTFLSAMAKSGTLTTSGVNLNLVNEFNPDLYAAVTNSFSPTSFINYQWQVASIVGNTFTGKIVDPSSTVSDCFITINKPSAIPSFTNIVAINQLSYNSLLPSAGAFQAVAVYNIGTVFASANITGNASCLNLRNCIFEHVCTPNQFASDMGNLLSDLQSTGTISSTSTVSISSNTVTNLLITPTIKNTIGTGVTSVGYQFFPPDKYHFFNIASPSDRIIITVTAENPPGTLTTTATFANMRSNYNSDFRLDCYNSSNVKVGDIDGKAEKVTGTQTVGISMGECALPTLPECSTTEHKVRKDLEALVNEMLTKKPITSGTVSSTTNLFNHVSFTPLLKSYLPVTLTTSTSGTYTFATTSSTANPNYDDMKVFLNGATSTCTFSLYHSRTDGAVLNFSNITNVKDLLGIGVPDAVGNYSDFSATATYTYPLSSSTVIATYTDVIYGHSCWPIKNCNSCPSSGGPISTARTMAGLDSFMVENRSAFYNPIIPAYNDYAAAVDSVNLNNGWTSMDSNYVQTMSFSDFTDGGFVNSDAYTDFLIHYDSTVDNRAMLDVNNFVGTYGNLTNCNEEYKRYVRAVAKYNIRASAVSGATIFAVIKDSVFYNNHLCDTTFAYIRYLKEYPAKGLTPDDILQFFNITNPNPVYLDSCGREYENYIRVHHDFLNDVAAQNNCKESEIFHPLYSYDEIEKNNLCGSSIGLNLFKGYVNSLKTASITCPSPLPSLVVGSNERTFAPISPLCHSYYISFVNAINAYNTSTYSATHSHTLDPGIYPSFYSFNQAGYCSCVLGYITYLNAYTTASATATMTPVLPLSIDAEPTICPHTVTTTPLGNDCDPRVYAPYVQAVIDYNTYAINSNSTTTSYTLPLGSVAVSYQDFVQAGYCTCAKKTTDAINAIVTNSVTDLGQIIAAFDLEANCGKPCTLGPPLPEFVFPPYVKGDNPCVQQKINIAMLNAANAYQQYKDSLTTYFADKYSRHCLNAFEDFNYKYDDKEYHVTLYYYDQAGNLIKTVPPEGVETMTFTSYTHTTAAKINYDRTYGQQNVFTEHRMATNYVYNSLNQLTYQSLPDHDNMDICDGTNPSGLDTGLVISSVQFVTPSKGYLCGYIKNNVIKRGYVYTSDDAGATWKKIDGVSAANFQKVQFVNANVGYAVSDFGMVFKTTNGGNTWDVMTGLYNPVSGGRQVGLITSLYFTSPTFGVVGGIKNGSTSFIYCTNDAGNTFTNVIVGSPVANGDSVTSITHDGVSFLATSRNGNRGGIHTSTNGTNWFKISTYAANNLKKVQYISSGVAFAVGEEGTLLKSNGANTTWSLVPTAHTGNIIDVYFKNPTDGVALIDSVPNKALLYKTFNGGVTWELFGGYGEYYKSLQVYQTANDKLIAAGSKGVLDYASCSLIFLNSSPFGITKLRIPSVANPTELSYADAVEYGPNDNILAVMTNSNTTALHQLYTTFNAQDPYPTWHNFYPTSWGALGGYGLSNMTFKKVAVRKVGVGNKPNIQVVALTTTGKLMSFYEPYNNNFSTTTLTFAPTAWAFPSSTASVDPQNFIDITADNTSSTTTVFYAFDKIANQFYKGAFATTTATAISFTAIPNSTATPITGTISSVDISNSGNEMIVVGDDGHIQVCSNFTTTPLVWSTVTNSVVPAALTDIKAIPTVSDNIIATGIDGSVWKNSGPVFTTPWKLVKSGTAEKLNAIDVDASGNGIIAANNGKLFKIVGANVATPTITPISSPITANLTDVAIDPSGGSSYVTAANGNVLFTSNYNTPAFSIASSPSKKSINGVAYKSANDAVVVGDNVLIANCSFGANSIVTKSIYTRGLYNIHFADANNGFVIDSANIIRRTTDGGNTWITIVPTAGTPISSGSPKLNRVYCTNPFQALLIGDKRYVSVINYNALSLVSTTAIPTTTVPTGTDFFDVSFNNNKYGVIVGLNAHTIKIAPSSAYTYSLSYIGQAATSQIPDLRTVHVFNDNSFITAGTKGKIIYSKSGVFNAQTSYTSLASVAQNTITIKDIYFRDDYSGYFAGDNGSVFKVKLSFPISSYSASANSFTWSPLCTSAAYLSYTNTTQYKNLDFNAIAFSSNTNGMLVGSDANVTIAGLNPNKYSRLIKEQSNIYSTRFFYDKLGRLIVSQNTKQINKKNPSNGSPQQAFGYTLYDDLGRIKEVGEKYENTGTTDPKFKSIFGTLVSGYNNPNAIDDSKFLSWINTNSGGRREVTQTYYDKPLLSVTFTQTQTNLRKRVASTVYMDALNTSTLTYNHATHYSYDIHGNVSTLWQENPKVGVAGQELKQINYEYDLISGKVNKVIYSPGQVDQFIHKYSYDADNRITRVETSKDGITYNTDAKYFYYAHGPLARVEYGKDHVQGVDYAYTLQGWIKGINSNILKPSNDIGNDGDGVVTNPNGNFARDVMGYSLNYYQGDYETADNAKWATTAARWEAATPGSSLMNGRDDLFNGNISAMVTSISWPDSTSGGVVNDPIALPQGNAYRYDQLNRIKRSSSVTNLSVATNSWTTGSSVAGLSRNTFTYDANGNITIQVKRDSLGNLLDSLTYNYQNAGGKTLRNRLYHVNDDVSTPSITNDIEDQGPISTTTLGVNSNYLYDEIGNLVFDKQEGIDSIRWNVYGKIKAVRSSTKDNLYFDYDASGNRIAKHVYSNTGVWKYSMFYERDAQGNVMSMYDNRTIASTMSYKWDEQHLYGSSRLGVFNPGVEMIGAVLNTDSSKNYLGQKHYELTNHLGNVLTVISDKKIQIANTVTTTSTDHYVANIVSATDYYVFGQEMYGRRFRQSAYSSAFNGKEKDDEVKGSGNSYDYGARIYDARLGKFLSVDPLFRNFTWNSPYAFSENRTIDGFDLDGLEVVLVNDNSKDAMFYYAGNKQLDKTAIHITAHGDPHHIRDKNWDPIQKPSQFNAMLNRESPEWRNRKKSGSTVIVLHSCRTGRDVVTKDGQITNSFAKKMSKAFKDVIFVAPDERVVVKGPADPKKAHDDGPFKFKYTDENADYISDKHGQQKDNHGQPTEERGNWNIFLNGKKVGQMPGDWKPTGQETKQMVETIEKKTKTTN